jgi:hypothetical protein
LNPETSCQRDLGQHPFPKIDIQRKVTEQHVENYVFHTVLAINQIQ